VAGVVFSESNGYTPLLIKKLAPLGDSSYSLYLIHVLLLDAATILVITSSSAIVEHIRQAGTIEMVAICGAMSVYCIVVAHILYRLVESRLVKGLRHLLPARTRLPIRAEKSAVKL
jgi:peptidoglycan/LPS O-acetylase OafA/YrhL